MVVAKMFVVRQGANWQENYPQDGEREYCDYFGDLGNETSISEDCPFREVECRSKIRSEDGAHMVHNESLKSAYESDPEIEHCDYPSMNNMRKKLLLSSSCVFAREHWMTPKMSQREI